MPKSREERSVIEIHGANVHNLKNISVNIPRNQMVVITGVSGSGKSSLAFDTLFAEGQRRYVESLSSYARQFLGRLDKPDVESIKGISPAIAIEQKVTSRNPRSTVGTVTEIYDYIKLLYARIGITYSPVSGKEVKRHQVTDVVNFINSHENGSRGMILSHIQVREDRTIEKQLELFQQQGYVRVKINDQMERIDQLLEKGEFTTNEFWLIIDRFSIQKESDESNSRLADSIQTAFFEGDGTCYIDLLKGDPVLFSNRFELDGVSFDEPNVHFFSFNNPVGACKTCEGFGSVIGIDEDLVIPNRNLSVYEDAIVAWRGEKMQEWKNQLVNNSHHFNFPIHKPIYELSNKEQRLLWTGNKHFEGLDAFFKYLEAQSYKIQYRVMMSRYRGKTICGECEGTKLRKDAGYVKISGKNIQQLVHLPIEECLAFFKTTELSEYQKTVGERLLIEITNRLHYLCEVGLGYLTLNRGSATLSGGESQRINLATSLGSSLVGSMYILDEPSIGLHPRDTERLISVLKKLKALGNSVIVVEHDEEIMRAADQIIDMGPLAGTHGGMVVFQGDHDALIQEQKSLTAKYLTGREEIEIPSSRRSWRNKITLEGVRENNLKGFDVDIPLGILTVITGVSGSGKSTLVRKILYPALKKIFGGFGDRTGTFQKLDGDLSKISDVEFIDQNPIGKSSRSNPVTYVKAFDEIRGLYSKEQLSKQNGFKPAHFSFNVDGGRCEVCEGEGQVKIEMQFMADVHLQCESCKGKRFKNEILEVRYHEKSIYDILCMTVDDAIEFFSKGSTSHEKKIIQKLKPLQDVGLGYVQLGQASSTLSGGEAQRIKLASFLTKGNTSEKTLFIFDEPTTGLHFHDIKKLLIAFNALIENGHSVVVIEHNSDVIKTADWIIDLGKEGGDQGGNLVFTGVPEDLIKCEDSYTGFYLKEKFISK